MRLSLLDPPVLHVRRPVCVSLDVIGKALVQQELDEPDLSGIRGRQRGRVRGANKIFLDSL